MHRMVTGFFLLPITPQLSLLLWNKRCINLGVEVLCSQRVVSLEHDGEKVTGVKTETDTFSAQNVVIATGGKGYPVLGAEGDGYPLAASVGHKVTELYPAMMPLKVKEKWVEKCRADTIAKVAMHVDMKKYKKLQAKGDLIFTKDGIRGPVVLDFSREITPLLSKFEEVPLLANFTKGMNEEQIRAHFKNLLAKDPHQSILDLMKSLLPESLSLVLCTLADADATVGFNKLSGSLVTNSLNSLSGHHSLSMDTMVLKWL